MSCLIHHTQVSLQSLMYHYGSLTHSSSDPFPSHTAARSDNLPYIYRAYKLTLPISDTLPLHVSHTPSALHIARRIHSASRQATHLSQVDFQPLKSLSHHHHDPHHVFLNRPYILPLPCYRVHDSLARWPVFRHNHRPSPFHPGAQPLKAVREQLVSRRAPTWFRPSLP